MKPEEVHAEDLKSDPYLTGKNLVDLVKRITKRNWTMLVVKVVHEHIAEWSVNEKLSNSIIIWVWERR